MNPETPVQNRCRLRLTKLGVLNFRNNTGALKDKAGRLVKFGLFTGSSDIIACKPVTITQDMVGKVIGQFTAIEVKCPGKDVEPGGDQDNFLKAVRAHGGLAGVAHSEDEAELIISGT